MSTSQFRTTLSRFLSYFVIAGMLARFGWLTMVIFVGAVAALFVFQWLCIRTLIAVVYGLILLSLVGLPLQSNLD